MNVSGSLYTNPLSLKIHLGIHSHCHQCVALRITSFQHMVSVVPLTAGQQLPSLSICSSPFGIQGQHLSSNASKRYSFLGEPHQLRLAVWWSASYKEVVLFAVPILEATGHELAPGTRSSCPSLLRSRYRVFLLVEASVGIWNHAFVIFHLHPHTLRRLRMCFPSPFLHRCICIQSFSNSLSQWPLQLQLAS